MHLHLLRGCLRRNVRVKRDSKKLNSYITLHTVNYFIFPIINYKSFPPFIFYLLLNSIFSGHLIENQFDNDFSNAEMIDLLENNRHTMRYHFQFLVKHSEKTN